MEYGTCQELKEASVEEVPSPKTLSVTFPDEPNFEEAYSAVYIELNEQHTFTESRVAELKGLMEPENSKS